MEREGRMRGLKFLAYVLPSLWIGAILLTLTGCPQTPLEQRAYRTIVGAKGFLDGVRKNHPECATGNPNASVSAKNSTATCTLLSRAVSAKDFLIDAAEVYCSGPQFESGGACSPAASGTDAAKQATVKLQAALNQYLQAEKDLKGAIQ